MVPETIHGNMATDDRGSLSFINDFDMKGIRRFYTVQNHSVEIVRAWHAHKKEEKYVTVLHGSAIVACVPIIGDWDKPSKNAKICREVLSGIKPSVIRIPPGYANGARALTTDTLLVYFTKKTLDESLNDDYRYAWDYWGKEVWEVPNR